MKWIQWFPFDIEKSFGGVETHALCLARELKTLGVQAEISSDPAVFKDQSWDVLHTHGSLYRPTHEIAPLINRRKKGIRVHTLHGFTHERMKACGEWTWPGGYMAIMREMVGMMGADICFAVHPQLHLFNWLTQKGKQGAVCGNGWDSWSVSSEKTPKVPEKPFWVFIGRGDDPVKGVGTLKGALKLLPDLHLLAVPGAGFEKSDRIHHSGRLSADEIHGVLQQAQGLALCSYYEAMPLVVLEALAEGVPVVAPLVGGVVTLPSALQGLVTFKDHRPDSLAAAIKKAQGLSLEDSARKNRAEHNRKHLNTWAHVARTCITTVEKALKLSAQPVGSV